MSNSSGSAVPLVGRILMSLVFLSAGISKIVGFSMMLGYVDGHLPLPKVSLACAAALEILGVLAILTGFHAKLASWVLFLFLIPTTFLFHNFWAMKGMEQMDNQQHFLKNLAIMGGLLILATHGADRYSLDSSGSKQA